jgi:hypothetical protein
MIHSNPTPPMRAATSLRPTRARYSVIVFAITQAVIQYIDRVCISQAAPFIITDPGLTTKQMGFLFPWGHLLAVHRSGHAVGEPGRLLSGAGPHSRCSMVSRLLD